MFGVQQVQRDFLLADDGTFSIRNLHNRVAPVMLLKGIPRSRLYDHFILD